MIKLPALPALKDYLNSDDGTPVDHWFDRRVRARDIEVARAVLEAAAQVLTMHQIPVGNSRAGEIACELTYDALKECRDNIRAMKIEGETT
jgi:hypothetical protein